MNFVDEAKIKVFAGNGGNGCVGFLRAKYVPFGGPDGGDGGDGGSIFLQADEGLNTLADFRHVRTYQARNGKGGSGGNCTGAAGEDLVIPVPIGTMVYDAVTEELIGDLTEHEEKLLVAQGGFHGLGNTRFKSSVNRAPRQHTNGSLGDRKELRLEMKVLADVGMLGMPNAGKSTFIRAVSSAKPKVADYPFTTLYPNLGVVRVQESKSFVVADIPGLIEGAADGAGLGIQFLKHLQRTHLLLHVIDVATASDDGPVVEAQKIIKELHRYSEELGDKPRWLLLNKLDLIPEDEQEQLCNDIVQQLDWQGPVFHISALNKAGTKQICFKIMDHIDKQRGPSLEEIKKAQAPYDPTRS